MPKTPSPKSVLAKNVRSSKDAASPEVIAKAIAGDPRAEALAALINAGNAAFAAQKGSAAPSSSQRCAPIRTCFRVALPS